MKLIGIISTAVLSLALGARSSGIRPAGAARPAGRTESQACPARKESTARETRKAREKVRSRRTRIPSKKRRTHSSRTRTISKKRKTRRSKRRTPSRKRMPSTTIRRTGAGASQQQLSTGAARRQRWRPHSRRPLSRPILDRNTGFVSAKAITVIAASNTVAIGSDSLTRGQATGFTRKTFM